MKVSQFVVSIMIAVSFMEVSLADEAGEMVAMKRPFCNNFTGCGRKRDPSYAVPIPSVNAYNTFNEPIPLLYRTLRLVPARNAAIAEWRLRQRLAEEAALDSLEQQQQSILPRAMLY